MNATHVHSFPQNGLKFSKNYHLQPAGGKAEAAILIKSHQGRIVEDNLLGYAKMTAHVQS